MVHSLLDPSCDTLDQRAVWIESVNADLCKKLPGRSGVPSCFRAKFPFLQSTQRVGIGSRALQKEHTRERAALFLSIIGQQTIVQEKNYS